MLSPKDGAVLIVDSVEAVEGLLHEETQSFLKTKGLKTEQPDWYTPAKTIFVYKIPHWISTKQEKEILAEINRCNIPLIATKITLIQRKNARSNDRMSMKIEFTTEEMATIALQRGLRFFDISHRLDLMERERSNKIPQCFKCFEYSHTSNECARKFALCSICGFDHHFSKCNRSNNPSCINCGGNHIAISKYCQIRQELIEKRERERQNLRNKNMQPPPSSIPSQTQYHVEFPHLPASPIDPQSPLIDDNYWAFRLNTIAKYAELMAKEDGHMYLDIINVFLHEHKLPTIPDPLMKIKKNREEHARKHKKPKVPEKPVYNVIDQESSKKEESTNKDDQNSFNPPTTYDQNSSYLPSLSTSYIQQGQIPLSQCDYNQTSYYSQKSTSDDNIVYSLNGTGPGIPPSLPPPLPDSFKIDQLRQNIHERKLRLLNRGKQTKHNETNQEDNNKGKDVIEPESDNDSIFGGQNPNNNNNNNNNGRESEEEPFFDDNSTDSWAQNSETMTRLTPPNSSQQKDLNHLKDLPQNSSDDRESDYHENCNSLEKGSKLNENNAEEYSDSEDSEQSSVKRLVIVSDDEVEEDAEVKLVLSSDTPTISESFEKDIGKAVAKKILEKANFLKTNKIKEEEAKKSEVKEKKGKLKNTETTKRNTRKTANK